MKTLVMKRVAVVLVLLTGVAQSGLAQYEPVQSPGWFNRYGRWSLGLNGGANMWINDFNTNDISGGADLAVRYALTRAFSLGVMAGYDALQSKNQRVVTGHYALQYGYVADKGFSADLVAWYHFNKGNPVCPYIYLGVGTVRYKRELRDGVGWPSRKTFTSIHIPIGLGLELATSRTTAVALELGACGLDRWSDNFVTGKANILGTDWFPKARVGVNLYLGSSDDDDNDGGGLSNGYEDYIGTDVNNRDTDGDGLSDFDEVTKYRTNAGSADTDHDGLNDGEEIAKLHTDVFLADTDDDSLTDGEEVMTYRTDPLSGDSDRDGLTDGDEVRVHHTNPLKADTDGGGVADALEIARGTNARDASDDVPKAKVMAVGKAITLDGIVFTSGMSTIEPGSETTLTEAFQVLKDNPRITVEIRGYTDNVGRIAANNKLSLRRAEAVRSWLVKKGIDSMRIAVAGFGQANPAADNSTPVGRARNRRIEFFRTR